MTTALEVVETGEVVHLMTTEEASSVTTQIVVKLDAIADNYQSVMPLIRDAITRQAHAALGYLSPGAYVADRFGSALSRLGAELRRQVVRELSEAGLSTRAIAPVIGVGRETVRRELASGDPCGSPEPDPVVTAELDLIEDDDEALTQEDCEALDRELSDSELARQAEAVETVVRPRVTGTDGKSYPKPPTPSTPKRPPLADTFWKATYDLGKGVARITKLTHDDRFNKNTDQIREKTLSDLVRARDALQCVIDQLTAQQGV